MVGGGKGCRRPGCGHLARGRDPAAATRDGVGPGGGDSCWVAGPAADT